MAKEKDWYDVHIAGAQAESLADAVKAMGQREQSFDRYRASAQKDGVGEGQIGKGCLLAIGAAPVLIIVIVVAQWLSYEIMKAKAESDVKDILKNVPSNTRR